jgi:hypothetical protein
MSVVRVEVRSKLPGGGDIPSVLVELANDRTTARELIRRAVIEQILVLRADRESCRRALDRHYLSADEICAQAATGVVKLPGRDSAAGEPVVDDEVARAHRAFERRVFVVFNGGKQVERLDEEVVLRLGEPVVFLRLTALVGG